jgi:hypothetical protein
MAAMLGSRAAPGAPFNDVNFVGSPRQRKADLRLVARNISVCTSGSNCMAKVTPTVGPLGRTMVTEMDPVSPTPTGRNGRPALFWQTDQWRIRS